MPTPQQNGPCIEVKDLQKSFGAQHILNGINLHVECGKTLAVMGRSGTGKSVLLKLLIGLQKADGGSVSIAGAEIGSLDERQLNEVRKKMGFLFQHAALYDSLTVADNVAFPLLRHAPMNETERKKTIGSLLESVGMQEHAGKMPSELSGGMQKRVGLARALALDPEILLFDEPTAGLDPITASEIGALIGGLKQKHHITGIVVTHDAEAVRAFSDLVILLDQGRIVAQGTFDELDRSADRFVSSFLARQSGTTQPKEKASP